MGQEERKCVCVLLLDVSAVCSVHHVACSEREPAARSDELCCDE